MVHAGNFSCPSCAVAVDSVSAHTRSMQCPHCGNWIYLSGSGWAAAGSFEHALDAPSMLRVGRSGMLAGAGRAFAVRGRLRLSYPSGYWDEWWLEFEDGNHQWLEEDDGRYRLHTPLPVSVSANAVQGAGVGTSLSIDGKNWFITERLEAGLAGTEGALPVAVQPGEQVICLDLMGSGQKLSLEASGIDVSVTRSESISGTAFQWND
ncbi:MAG: DUF4178 domain-containing protein [Pseudomonadota bacterium]